MRQISCFHICVILILLAGPLITKAQRTDSLRYPITDRRGDAFSAQSRNPFDLRDTSLIKRRIEYDPKTKQYYIIEKIGKGYYRTPTYLSFDQYWRLSGQQAEADYFKQRADALTLLNKKAQRPKMRVYNKLFDRIFGINNLIGGSDNKLKVDIRPSGEVNIMAG